MKITTLTADKAAKKFQFLAFNRPVKPRGVAALADSVKRNGLIRPVTIIRTKSIDGSIGYYIGDGQHLYHALLGLKMNIPYVVIDCKTLEDVYQVIIQLNTTAKTWKLADYIRTWASSGRGAFQRMVELHNETDLPYTQLVTILSGNSRTTYKIKDGTFSIHRKNFAYQVAREVTLVKELVTLNSDQVLSYYLFKDDLKDDRIDFDIENFLAVITHNKKIFKNVWSKSSVEYWREKFHELWGS